MAEPLSPEEEAELRERHWAMPARGGSDDIARLLATLDRDRAARRASDAQVAGLLCSCGHDEDEHPQPCSASECDCIAFDARRASDAQTFLLRDVADAARDPDGMWHDCDCEWHLALRDRLAALDTAATPAPQPATPPLDMERLALALMHIGVAAENVASMGNAEQWVPDKDAARKLAAEYARLAEREVK